MNFRIESASSPFDSPEIARQAIETIATAAAMGLLPEKLELQRLDQDSFQEVARSILSAGIGSALAGEVLAWQRGSAETLLPVLRKLQQAMVDSPVPGKEWPSLLALLGAPLLGRLVGASPSSMRRYAAQQRPTPPSLCDRLHFLALVAGALAGSYNEEGIRRWFERPRRQLGNQSPTQVLHPPWQSHEARALRVSRLAESLLSTPAT